MTFEPLGRAHAGVHLRGRMAPDGERAEGVYGNCQGWPQILDALKGYLEHQPARRHVRVRPFIRFACGRRTERPQSGGVALGTVLAFLRTRTVGRPMIFLLPLTSDLAPSGTARQLTDDEALADGPAVMGLERDDPEEQQVQGAWTRSGGLLTRRPSLGYRDDPPGALDGGGLVKGLSMPSSGPFDPRGLCARSGHSTGRGLPRACLRLSVRLRHERSGTERPVIAKGPFPPS
jgi:hypothetical protein